MIDMDAEPYLLASTLAVVVAHVSSGACAPRAARATSRSPQESPPSLRSDFAHLARGLREYGVISASDDWFNECPLLPLDRLHRLPDDGLSRPRRHLRDLPGHRRGPAAIMDRRTFDPATGGDQAGMRTMLMDGVAKAVMGETSLEEVFRAAL